MLPCAQRKLLARLVRWVASYIPPILRSRPFTILVGYLMRLLVETWKTRKELRAWREQRFLHLVQAVLYSDPTTTSTATTRSGRIEKVGY